MNTTNLPFKVSLLATTIALTACGGSSSSGNNSPEGLTNNNPGTYVMSAKGGNAHYSAGNGGDINIGKQYSSAPLNISVNGLPDTRYDVPEITINLGSNPLTITADTTIAHYNATVESGDLYLYNDRIYRYDGAVDNDDDPVIGKETSIITGLSIASGAVLTLDNNGSNVDLYLYNDLQNAGEITLTSNASSSVPSLDLYLQNYLGSGSINLAGQEIGQNAGSLNIYATTIQNSGTFNTSGADGDNTNTTGSGSRIELMSLVLTHNSGSIVANSGSNTESRAASANDIALYSIRDVVNTGSIDASAGSGVNDTNTYIGGDVYLNAPNLVLNTGNITANGSSSVMNADQSTGGEGGDGGSIEILLSGEGGGEGGATHASPRLINTGDLQVNGGNSADDNQTAGDGGNIYIETYESNEGDKAYTNPVVIAISGNLLANGGNATATSGTMTNNAGNGGDINITHYAQVASDIPTQIVGYSSINASGGDALRSGRGGSIEILGSSNSDDDDATVYAPAPSIDITTDLVSDGGTVTTPTNDTYTPQAGHGGDIELWINTEHSYLQDDLSLTFEGNASANASDVSNANESSAGSFYAYTPQQLTIRGSIALNGSNDTAIPVAGESDGHNDGGRGGFTYLFSQFGNINFDAQLTANGGNGQLDGGEGGFLILQSSKKATVNGSISLTGGNASATTVNDAETDGGEGGMISIISNSLDTELNASYTITPGTGTDVGINGGVFVDDQCISGICTTNMF